MFRHTNPWQGFLTTFALSGLRLNHEEIAGQEIAGAEVEDEILTSTVYAIIQDKLGKHEIAISTVGSHVKLMGRVDSPQIRARAERIARDISGVRGVRNRLIVRVPNAEHPTCMQNGS